MNFHRALLWIAGLLAPSHQREEWLAEWRAELCYIPPERATAFCLGAFHDAFWLRRNNSVPAVYLQSPWTCLGVLAAFAAISVFCTFRLPLPRRLVAGHFLSYLVALLVCAILLPSVTDISLGEYPANRRRWLFLVVKTILVLPIVLFGSIDLFSPIAVGLQPHALIVGGVIGFRWILVDQRRRCPTCLRILGNPTSIGAPSHTLLEWYGTELVCSRGHGLLHVPEIRNSYSEQRWLRLDSSWSSLFSCNHRQSRGIL
jgi:hypothetical protein